MNKCWIFDFDGTLVDSEKHIRETFLKITKEMAPERIGFASKVLIGPPLEETAKEILGDSRIKSLNIFTENFIKIHDDEILKNITPYTKSQQILEKLFKMGHKIALATNKRKAPTIKIINHLGWNNFFLSIECSDSGIKPRNKFEMIEDLFRKDIDFKNPLNIKAYQYDIVCNGIELSSGAIRNHVPELMYKLFSTAGYQKEQVDEKFSGMINALSYGAPPHGGIAPGIDRIVMLLANEKNIREVTMFPMNQNAQDLMMNAPSEVNEEQLKELGLEIKKRK